MLLMSKKLQRNSNEEEDYQNADDKNPFQTGTLDTSLSSKLKPFDKYSHKKDNMLPETQMHLLTEARKTLDMPYQTPLIETDMIDIRCSMLYSPPPPPPPPPPLPPPPPPPPPSPQSYFATSITKTTTSPIAYSPPPYIAWPAPASGGAQTPIHFHNHSVACATAAPSQPFTAQQVLL